MLRIQQVILRLVASLRPVIEAIAQRDADLGRQMRRALMSVPLNLAEGSSSRGLNRAARYHTASGSMREVGACIDVAMALEYVAAPPECVGDIALIANTLSKLARQ